VILWLIFSLNNQNYKAHRKEFYMDNEQNMPVEARQKPLILLADDDVDIRTLVRLAIENIECDIIEASDGEIALEQILVEAPDLVVLDVMMPGLTGWEVCKYVKSKEDYKDTLILMLTAIGETVNQMTAPLYGADAYLDKPFDMDEIVKVIQGLLGQH
jgi:DNA-binding response OmpR family regulator